MARLMSLKASSSMSIRPFAHFILVLLVMESVGLFKANAQNRYLSAVPFLKIAPDARSTSMGDVGVATDPDVYSMHWNAAKYVFAENDWAIGMAHTPWLQRLADGMGLSLLSHYRKFGESQAIALSLKFFSLGDFQFSDGDGNQTGRYRPNEFSIDAAYVRKLSPSFSASVAFRYIQSAVGGYSYVEGNRTQGNGISADVGAYYSKAIHWGKSGGNIAIGISLTNIGPEINYGTERLPLPTNLRFGTTIKKYMGGINHVNFSFDVDKPMVFNSIAGTHKKKSELEYLSTSRELRVSSGIELNFMNAFSFRTGCSFSPNKFENQRYFTLGAGVKIRNIGTDFSYLLPFERYNPIGNTVRIGLYCVFG